MYNLQEDEADLDDEFNGIGEVPDGTVLNSDRVFS